MKTKIKAFLHWHKYSWQTTPEYQLRHVDMSGRSPEYVLISEHEFELDIPDNFDPRPQQIKALREEKQKILADATAKATNIEEQIQTLLSLDCKP